MTGASSSQHLGLFNLTNNGDPLNHIFGIEFDVFNNQEFDDINDNHVGLDVNSLTSVTSYTAGYWGGENDEKFKDLELDNGVNYQVWVDFLDSIINVTLAPTGMKKPQKPLISEHVNLSLVLLDEMYVGFTGATGQLVESHRILAWSFSNTNFSIGDALITQNLPSFVVSSEGSVFESQRFIIGFVFAAVFLLVTGIGLLIWRKRKRKRQENKEIEDWELEYWPHRIGYQEIQSATNGFSEKNVIGFGGNGKVYKGVMSGGIQVAVKRISIESENGMREFLAEISCLGRLQHRNLVGLRGWCKSDTRSLVLVYDYMENGSLDKRIFECDESIVLNWEERVKVLRDVASGILYLHEGWEAKVLHRDIKASNVLLDKDMNARLGDFGLARMHHHGHLARTTQVIGTVGYMAPEVVRTGRALVNTDVYGFGVLVLEVVCGRRPIEDGKPGLIDWVWRLMDRGELVSALDERLKNKPDGYSTEEVEKVLKLGLLCVNPEPHARPTMRQVVKLLERPIDAAETLQEGIDVNLIENMESTSSILSMLRWNFDSSGLPTFEEVKESLSSASLSGSDIIRIGR